MRALVLSGGSSHGAFQVGAMQTLYKLGWVPDIVCGSSVGAINAVGLASGKSPDDMANLWRRLTTEQVYRLRRLRDITSFWKWSHFLDTSPLRKYLASEVAFDTLSQSDMLVSCFSVDVVTGGLRSYVNRDSVNTSFDHKYMPRPLDLDAVMASTAIPLVFPWIRGEWDGSIRQYAPVKPAVVMGADDIVVIALEAWEDGLVEPSGILQTAMRIVDISSVSRMQDDIRRTRERNSDPKYRHINLRVISPTQTLGYSKLSFSHPNKEFAIRHGSDRAMEVMNE